MEETVDYNSMPRDFAHCLNAGCERAGECLRHRMALLMPAERGTVTIVNPRAVDPSGRDCAYFKPGQAVTYALGITRLLDDLPHAKSVVIKQQLIRHFGRTLYYRFRRKERKTRSASGRSFSGMACARSRCSIALSSGWSERLSRWHEVFHAGGTKCSMPVAQSVSSA